MKLKIAAILLLLLCVCACKKKVEDVNKDFIGSWISYDQYDEGYLISIYINNNSYGYYKEGDCDCGFNGIVRANSHKLKIGDIYHFNIIYPPHKIDTATSTVYIYLSNRAYPVKADWTMTLSEAYPAFYYKGNNLTYYRADY